MSEWLRAQGTDMRLVDIRESEVRSPPTHQFTTKIVHHICG